jgi:hypothetical protein
MNPTPDEPLRTTPAEPRSREVVVTRCADIAADAEPSADEKHPAVAAPLGEQAVDDAVEMTFPASDPPAWMSSGMVAADPAQTDSARPSTDGS